MAKKKRQQTLEEYMEHCLPTIVNNTILVYTQKRTCEYIGNVGAQLFVNSHAHEEKPRLKYINHFLDLYSSYRERGIDDFLAEFKALKHTQIRMLQDYYHEQKEKAL